MTIGIIVVTTVVYIASLSPEARVFDTGWYWKLIFSVSDVENGEMWRMVTSALLHGSPYHLGVNMYVLYLFGVEIEKQYGRIPFVLLYLASAAAGSAAMVLLAKDYNYGLGASGATFGLLGLVMMSAYLIRDTVIGKQRLAGLWPWLAINVVLTFVPGIGSRIAWQAHLGGFIAGCLIGYVWDRVTGESKLARTGTAAAVFVLSLGFAMIV